MGKRKHNLAAPRYYRKIHGRAGCCGLGLVPLYSSDTCILRPRYSISRMIPPFFSVIANPREAELRTASPPSLVVSTTQKQIQVQSSSTANTTSCFLGLAPD